MAINPFGGVEPDDDEEQSEMHKIVKTVDGRLHVFPRDASDLDLERFQWRYDNGQEYLSVRQRIHAATFAEFRGCE